MRWFVLASLGLAAFTLAYALGLRVLHNKTIYPFDQTVFDARGFSIVQVGVLDTDPLTAYIRKSTRPNAPVILFFMGNSGTLAGFDAFLQPHLAADRTVIAMGYPGGGGLSGHPTEHGLKLGALALFDNVDDLVGPGHGPIIVHGYSLGTGLAIHIAATRNVDGVILDAPFTRVCALFLKSFGPGACALPFFQKWNSLAEAPRISAPVLIHQGARDIVVPMLQAQMIAKAVAGSVVFETYEKAGHTDIPADPRYAPGISNFISALSKS